MTYSIKGSIYQADINDDEKVRIDNPGGNFDNRSIKTLQQNTDGNTIVKLDGSGHDKGADCPGSGLIGQEQRDEPRDGADHQRAGHDAGKHHPGRARQPFAAPHRANDKGIADQAGQPVPDEGAGNMKQLHRR